MNNDIVVRNSTVDTPNRRHNNIRQKNEEADYLKSMAKRHKLYDNAMKQQQEQHQLADVVDLQIDLFN